MQAALLIAVVILAGASAQTISSSLNFTTPVTVPMMAGMRSNSTTLALDDPSLPGATAGPNDPTQVHLSPAGPNAIFVMWATKTAKTGQGSLVPNDPTSSSSIVKYGADATSLTMTATGTVEIYNQIYNTSGNDQTVTGGPTARNYTSPLLHTARLTDLTPNTTVYYQVGDGMNFSAIYNFTTLQAPGPYYPQRIIALADWGLSHNSTVTRDHAVQSAYSGAPGAVVQYIADFSYADTWFGNGTVSLPTSGFEGYKASTWQPVWDSWMRMIEPLVSHVPMMTCTGNHEIEAQEDANNTIFASVQARWKVASNSSKSNNYFFHSIEYGPVHSISLTVYVNYLPGSPQWNWLWQDLSSVNRTLTPWIVVNFHNPWYTTDPSYKEFEQMRVSMEPMMYAAGVDVVFYGHVHAYERSFPVYDYKNDACGTSHITIGDAGNTEGLSFLNAAKNGPNFEDFGAGCTNVSTTPNRVSYITPVNPANDPWNYYARALTFQADGNSTGVGNPIGFCYKEQPAWSAYREPSFGHGVLDVMNGTHALWNWHRNQDNNAVAADSVYIVRDTANCMNKMYPQIRSTNGAALAATA